MTRRTLLIHLCGAVLVAMFAGPLSGRVHAQEAKPTRVMVRALAHDAKVIGSGVGGARIVIEEASTGRVLAEGVQEGGTGDTGLIMEQRPRRGAFDNPSTAGFLATIELEEPTLVDIMAVGPLGTPDRQVQSTKRMMLVPGVDVLGDGVVLELNGLTVEVLAPIDTARANRRIPVRAKVTMLCGCPTEPGGRWDADRIRVLARLRADGRPIAETELEFAGEMSTFEGTFPPARTGDYELEVLAMDPSAANFGRSTREVRIRTNQDLSGD